PRRCRSPTQAWGARPIRGSERPEARNQSGRTTLKQLTKPQPFVAGLTGINAGLPAGQALEDVRMSRKIFPSLAALAVGVLAAGPAFAIDDRFTLRLSGMKADADTTLSGITVFQGQPYSFEETFDLGDDEIIPRVEGEFHFGDRHRVLFNYMKYDREVRSELGEPISFEDVTIPAGSFAAAEVGLHVAALLYDFAVVETETLSLGLQVGLEYAKLEGRLSAA